MTSCTVLGMGRSARGRVSTSAPDGSRARCPSSTSPRTISSAKNGLPPAFATTTCSRSRGSRLARDRAHDGQRVSLGQRAQGDLGERCRHAPRRTGVGTVRDHDEHGRALDPTHQIVEQLAGRLVDPLQVLEHHHDGPRFGLGHQQSPQGIEGLAPELLGRLLGEGLDGQRQEAAEERVGALHLLVRAAELRRHLGARRLDGLVPFEIEVASEHHHERVVGQRLHHRRAAALEERHVSARKAVLELVDQARLAAAGVADHGDDLGLFVGQPGEGFDQAGQLALAPHERREAALLRDAHPGHAAEPVLDRVRHDRLALAAHTEGPDGLDAEEAAHQAVGGFADQDGARAVRASAGGRRGWWCRRSPRSPSCGHRPWDRRPPGRC